ncbi:Outer membrane protein [Collimonas arenae]|uniref:Outer membrane protein n=2 Tax=Collimonas arenae TaxID=279058 RepID=A0A0A1FDA3_9BURK|nr:Outer membrane protein [Collimonas arenae]
MFAAIATFADVAHAQTALTIYGRMDIGAIKQSHDAVILDRGANNVLGFQGTEDLGGGLSALFQLEMRFEPGTGALENNGQRPLFQGQSRVGLNGAFGTIRLGRGLTAVQDPNADYDPFFTNTVGSLINFQTANYDSDPFNPSNSANRFSNALFYNTPVMGGFQLNATVASREPIGIATTDLPVNPVSVSGTYNNGPVSAMLGYERNALSTKFWQAAGSYKIGSANLMASYSQQNQSATVTLNPKTRGWSVGADVVAGPGNVKAGYAQVRQDGHASDKKASIGYWYNLSKRTYLYTDAARTKTGDSGDSINAVDFGIQHSF